MLTKEKLDNAPIIVNREDLQELIEGYEERGDKMKLYNEVLSKVELFLTFCYEHTTEFGKIKDDFNESDEVDAELRLQDDRIKIKIGNEKNSSSS